MVRIYDLTYKAIESISARKILDSRGHWTIEAVVNGHRASAPAGASVGTFEAKTVDAARAVEIVNTKLQELVGMQLNQLAVDMRLRQIDGTNNFSRIGGNTAIAVSSAVYKALNPQPKGFIFPHPLCNVFGGGKHGGRADIQEFLMCATKAKTMLEAMELVVEAYYRLKEELKGKVDLIGMNDEGALVAKIPDLKILDLISSVAEDLNLGVGMDMASTTFYDKKNEAYVYKNLGKKLSAGEQTDFVLRLIKDYDLFYVEDPLYEEDFDGFARLNKKAKRCLITGDDLTVTNLERLNQAIKKKSVKALIIKPNQIGTISLTKETVDRAKKAKIVPVVSHRSGETSDVTISHLALDWQIPIIKAGISDLTTKLNELVRLWETMKNPAMARVVFS